MPEPSFMIREHPLAPDAIDRPFVDLALTPQAFHFTFVRTLSGGDLIRLDFTPSGITPACTWLIRLGEILLAQHGPSSCVQMCIQAAHTDFAEQIGEAVLQRRTGEQT